MTEGRMAFAFVKGTLMASLSLVGEEDEEEDGKSQAT